MPLSEHEQRLLEQIEQGLYAEDPKFASAVRRVRSGGGTRRRRVILAVVGAVVGLGVVLLALVTNIIVLGVLGFLLIVAACAYALMRPGTGNANSGPLGVVEGDRVRSRRQSGMKERMEDRLRRRFDEE